MVSDGLVCFGYLYWTTLGHWLTKCGMTATVEDCGQNQQQSDDTGVD
jgi:hypothetical protein